MKQSPKPLFVYLLSLFGTIVEYYDYALYGLCAALLSHYFFAESDATVSLIKTYGLFTLSGMGRPAGSLIFGWLGDRFGRGYALRRSMVGIAIPTTIIALTPNQETWGFFSALIILVCRFLQGVFVAGEGDGVRIYLYESRLGKYPYIANALVGMSMLTGAFLASLGASFAFRHSSLWYWRLPFIVGGCLGLIIFLLRRRFINVPLAKAKTAHQGDQPSLINWRGILATILLMGASGGTYHLFFVFRPTFVSQLSAAAIPSQALTHTSFSLLFYIVATLISAFLAERFGGRRVVLSGAISLVMLTLGFSHGLMDGQENLLILMGFTFALSMISAPAFVLVMRQFHPTVRFRSASISHSIGYFLLSGSAPFLATFLWKHSMMSEPFTFHLIFLVGLVLVALGLLKPQEYE
jgi:MHS family proline/betaine transporter-like MFS transporter